ncbi:hypothetical protein K505DRAFT_321640 [Melanomma pulvis-pyrius CBS 109.77]|uniref:Uncharacterized protein n=1 Tax=Melanomma pulvis-pyrius CBS 109.77 TaxID=1314802 RepID=A0A6A6XRA3_9PLEO|nr:hypothetical protein K505DRAFT_321640 [Melanomma pulvis-pyrius CBS 109.77]
MSHSNLSTLISVPQWDPIEILSINQKPDGNFTCSGVKNGTATRCGFHLRGETALKISDLLDEISMLPPQIAVQSLKPLADNSLCLHHKLQARGKVIEWIAAINRLPPSTQAGPNIQGQHTSSPPHRPPPSPLSISSQSQGSNVSSRSVSSRYRSQPGSSPIPEIIGSTVEDKKRRLREDIERLTAELDSLEMGGGEVSNSASSRQVARQSSSRTGLRATLFGRTIN